VRLKLRLFDFSTTVRQRSVPPTQDDLVLYAAAKELLQQNWNGRAGIRLLGVTAAQLAEGSAAVQQTLFEPARDQKGLRVLRALDAIRDRHGEDAVHRGMAKRSTTPWGPGVE
jgi:DNA polymerase-4